MASVHRRDAALLHSPQRTICSLNVTSPIREPTRLSSGPQMLYSHRGFRRSRPISKPATFFLLLKHWSDFPPHKTIRISLRLSPLDLLARTQQLDFATVNRSFP